MGLGIGAMHYTGMAAMEMSPPIQLRPAGCSSPPIVIAIVASLAALWIAFNLRGNENWMIYAKLGSAVIMGFAITGMHYTGMAAARFAPDSFCLTGASVDNSWMAGTIAGFTFVILCVTLVLSLYDARMASKTARMAASLQEANEELQRMALAGRPDQAAQPHAARRPARPGDRPRAALRRLCAPCCSWTSTASRR